MTDEDGVGALVGGASASTSIDVCRVVRIARLSGGYLLAKIVQLAQPASATGRKGY